MKLIDGKKLLSKYTVIEIIDSILSGERHMYDVHGDEIIINPIISIFFGDELYYYQFCSKPKILDEIQQERIIKEAIFELKEIIDNPKKRSFKNHIKPFLDKYREINGKYFGKISTEKFKIFAEEMINQYCFEDTQYQNNKIKVSDNGNELPLADKELLSEAVSKYPLDLTGRKDIEAKFSIKKETYYKLIKLGMPVHQIQKGAMVKASSIEITEWFKKMSLHNKTD